ncbi:MAG: SMC-Scp complex subunit ScpB [Lachnospiraceae bacterium]|nr:SMC-Scp complex subunit ScpB [Lachnospiraceae bacterium]
MKGESVLEGVLFAMGNSVEKRLLAETLEISAEELEALAESLARYYEEENRGLRLITLEDKLQLSTARDCYETLIKMVKKPAPPVLTEVVLETLSIIAYKQPVTKGDIERIRGVSSDHAVNKLVEYGLVEEAGRLNAPGRPILFKTSEEFLRRFNLSTVEELPQMDPVQYQEILASVESEVAAAEATEKLAREEARIQEEDRQEETELLKVEV